jgi:hypothetical protein
MQSSSITIALVTLTLVAGCAGDTHVHGRAADQRAAAGSSAAASVRRDEMLVNGSFAKGTRHWVVEESGATGRAECVKEGPDGKASLRLTVLTVGTNAWRLQLYHAGIRIEKGRTYDLTFWARSDRAAIISVNCMQNHEPWDHHTQIKLPVSTEWKQLRFTFVGPWTDDKARICFTDLGTTPGQVYWFANCSLVPTNSP